MRRPGSAAAARSRAGRARVTALPSAANARLTWRTEATKNPTRVSATTADAKTGIGSGGATSVPPRPTRSVFASAVVALTLGCEDRYRQRRRDLGLTAPDEIGGEEPPQHGPLDGDRRQPRQRHSRPEAGEAQPAGAERQEVGEVRDW